MTAPGRGPPPRAIASGGGAAVDQPIDRRDQDPAAHDVAGGDRQQVAQEAADIERRTAQQVADPGPGRQQDQGAGADAVAQVDQGPGRPGPSCAATRRR